MEAISQKHIPPGLAANELEFYWDKDEQALFALLEGQKYAFGELPKGVLNDLADKMQEDEEAMRIFEAQGPKPILDRLFIYCKCNFGGFSFTAVYINGLLDKEHWNCQCNGNCLLEPVTRNKAYVPNGYLTQRELEVLRHLCRPPYKIGDAIAHDLEISENTLNRHKSRIFIKCGVSCIQELAVLATKMDLL
jgi:DNA-binding CsgD family transcriptional regulator